MTIDHANLSGVLIMSTIKDYMRQYEEMLRCKTGSEATLKNYLWAVERFLHWCNGKRGEPVDLLRQYLAWAIKSCAKTSNLHRAAIVSFFSLVKGIDISVNDVPRKKEPKQLPHIITREKMQEAIAKTLNIKHRIEIMLFYAAGLRLGEVTYLRRKNIMLDRGILWLESTKGNRHRIVPIPESAKQLLAEFVRDMAPDEYVFKGQCGESNISKKSLQNVVSQALARVGEHAHPHMLRHSFATHKIMAGESPFHVQRWLGHGSIKTTQIYVNLAEDQLATGKDLLTKEN